MPIFQVTKDALTRLPDTSFGKEGILERKDLQRLLRQNIAALEEDLMVIAEEFGDWSESMRRIDLLCLDTDANLVVVELKRTEDGGHMELQAVRYAAMISPMTLAQAVSSHARFLNVAQPDESAAQAAILKHLGWDAANEDAFGQSVRIILAAADFSKELTTSVLWLNEQGLDIRCVRMKPYKGSDGAVLLDVQSIIPLPETAEYIVNIRAKEQAEKTKLRGRDELRYAFWAELLAFAKTRTDLHANRSPDRYGWIGGGIGKSGFALNYASRGFDSQVELYIDFGPESETKNKAVLTELKSHQAQVEKAFGGELEWQDLPERRASRIRKVIEGGYRSPRDQWPAIHAALVDDMIRLHKALQPLVQAVKA